MNERGEVVKLESGGRRCANGVVRWKLVRKVKVARRNRVDCAPCG
jgi:hypothetical protein